MAYATVTEVKAYLKGVDLSVLGNTTEQDAAISAAADGATGRVDRSTHRTFTTASATRQFNGNGTARLFVPDLLTLTGWSMDGQAQDAESLTRYPLSTTPTLWLLYKDGLFSPGSANVEITGTWGYASTVPAAIVTATALLAASEIYLRIAAATDGGASGLGQGGLTRRFEGGAYESTVVRLQRQAEAILRAYRRPVFS